MKRLLILSLVILGISFVAPVWAHHMAEGIVSDEVWTRVDENLDGTLHDINLESALDSMMVETDSNGNQALVTTYDVLTTDLDIYMTELDAVIEQLEDERQGIPSGSRNSVEPDDPFENLLVFSVDDPDTGMTTIYVYEPVGAGQSQDGDGIDTMPSGKQ